jgi:hypothetical protein
MSVGLERVNPILVHNLPIIPTSNCLGKDIFDGIVQRFTDTVFDEIAIQLEKLLKNDAWLAAMLEEALSQKK